MRAIYDSSRIHPSWCNFFSETQIKKLRNIEAQLNDNFNPQADRVLRFASSDLSAVKIVILGQDPYPQKGISTGRAFEVGNLESWSQKFPQSSLRNILRCLYQCYNGELKTLDAIRREIEAGQFKILPPNQLFESWEKQGVLLLNTYLTCEVNKPGSHKNLWASFSDSMLSYIAKANPQIVWFLWGREAIAKIKLIGDCKVYASNHPMILSPRAPKDFSHNPCFAETMKDLHMNWLGV